MSNQLPKAASAWIIHESGLVLAVSRKHDETDLGLPGGKLDPGESFSEAVRRETKEETNLDIQEMLPLFAAPCGIPGIHNVHFCMTFLCRATGELKRMEKGLVVWVPPSRLVAKPDGTLNSFGDYNRQVQKALETLSAADATFYTTRLPLNQKFLLPENV